MFRWQFGLADKSCVQTLSLTGVASLFADKLLRILQATLISRRLQAPNILSRVGSVSSSMFKELSVNMLGHAYLKVSPNIIKQLIKHLQRSEHARKPIRKLTHCNHQKGQQEGSPAISLTNQVVVNTARATPVHTCRQGKVSMEFGTKTSRPRMHHSHAYASTCNQTCSPPLCRYQDNSLDSDSSVSPPQRSHHQAHCSMDITTEAGTAPFIKLTMIQTLLPFQWHHRR